MSIEKMWLLATAEVLLLVGCRSLPGGLTPAIDPAHLTAMVQTLASDAYEGRAPGTDGETMTIAYLQERFRSLGLEPGGENGGWTQAVPLIRTQLGVPRGLSLSIRGQSRALTQGTEIYLNTVRNSTHIDVRAAPLVFVGYGATAPERQWDDFKGVDVAGKVVVMLVNDPDFHAVEGEPVTGRFGGRRMTYYGRCRLWLADRRRVGG
ncbi:MAG TPA: hypothetical protein PLC64_04335 [Steroidobacteraceae bacterium]|nr:hypothetical protein [Steroidobacteraceae bacterium]